MLYFVCVWSIHKCAVPCFTTVFPQVDRNKVWPGGEPPYATMTPTLYPYLTLTLSPKSNPL